MGLALSLQQYERLRLGGFDFGLFDQAMRAYSRFELPRSPIKSVHHEYPPEFSLLGDHFSPLIALAAPFYWLWNDPRVLLLVQAVLFALGVPLVARLARAEVAPLLSPRFARRFTWAACLVYALGAPLLFAARAGFHEVAFAVPLFLLLFERARARAYHHMLWAGALLCLTKEDLGLVVGVFGAVVAARARRSGDSTGFRAGLVLFFAGFLASLLAVSVAIPAMGGSAGFYWQYSRLGDGPVEALRFVVLHPLDTLVVALTPVTKSYLLLWTFGSLLFLPLGSPLALCALPLLAERLFSDNENHWQAVHHYGAFLWPILVAASLETTGSLLRRTRREKGRDPLSPSLFLFPFLASRRTAMAGIIGVAGITLAGFVLAGACDLFDIRKWKPDEPSRALVRAAEKIPDRSTVEADNYAAPRLTGRTHVMLLDRVPRNAEWVLISTGKRVFPFGDVQQQRDRVSLLESSGYQKVYEEQGVHLMRRTSPHTTVPGSRIPGPDSTPVNDDVPKGIGRRLFG
ncbi:DUF2079 domain-containing protein [Streptomyces sp. NPDC021093]|uniref:DUF2079 domain-containing protein n=1 Tax=Streptomyces sp. NPDC021093 TaxID=3365112 RepID=UPI0037AE2611